MGQTRGAGDAAFIRVGTCYDAAILGMNALNVSRRHDNARLEHNDKRSHTSRRAPPALPFQPSIIGASGAVPE